MLKILFITLISVTSFSLQARAQSDELQQLILDIEKLNQLKAILNEMYKGYEIISTGYNTIKDLSQGNFNLHKLFLDGLLAVSPTVKKYQRIIDIIIDQKTLVSEYKSAFSRFKTSGLFNQKDLDYFQSVYDNLFTRSLKNLDELLMVITDNQLRMSDAERLTAIDRLHADMQDKLQFLRYFNDRTSLLAKQREQEMNGSNKIEQLYGIQK